jgi:hypothetical protein
MGRERGYININSQTKDALKSLKAPGQSYDGVIRQLVELWKREMYQSKTNDNHANNSNRRSEVSG